VLADLDVWLDVFETRARASGAEVLWARDGDEVARLVVDIARRHGVTKAAKSKSMLSEEAQLNEALAAAGIRPVETDLGEYIVQLAGEKPSHIIMPAIHKTKEEIARLFADKVPGVMVMMPARATMPCGSVIVRGSHTKPGRIFDSSPNISWATSTLEVTMSLSTVSPRRSTTQGRRRRGRSVRSGSVHHGTTSASTAPKSNCPNDQDWLSKGHTTKSVALISGAGSRRCVQVFMACSPAPEEPVL
jgi:hypothetical protein